MPEVCTIPEPATTPPHLEPYMDIHANTGTYRGFNNLIYCTAVNWVYVGQTPSLFELYIAFMQPWYIILLVRFILTTPLVYYVSPTPIPIYIISLFSPK